MGIRVNRNASIKERRTYTFDNFKGVDFSTSPYKVAGYRATQAKNLIYKDGTVRKRNGWQSLCKLPAKINGLFSFEIEDEEIVLCCAGTQFYRLIWNENLSKYESVNITNSCTYEPAQIDTGRLVERRLQVQINANKAYIIGAGDYLVFGKWGDNFELRRVYNNEDTYIPTTTINIDEDSVEDENRGALDEVNLLSPYRKNEMLGVDAESGTWTVDTAIKGVTQAINADSFIEIKIYTYEGTTPIEIELNNRLEDKTKLYKVGGDLTVVGTVDFANGKITLNINTKPQEEDSANIIIKFEKSVEGQEDDIANATISTVFGGGGASNRLFVSGNSNRRNVHAWSELYDFTYFPDNNFDKIGSDSSAIVGYVRESDGTLLTFKEANGSDAHIYYITGTDTAKEDYRGDIVFITEFFKKAGSMADTILTPFACANLNGDNLILTKNGVKGLQLYENISIENYRLQERGRNISKKLLQHTNLTDACACVFENKYFLSVGGVVYIADGQFTFQNEEDINSSYNYEWWYWDNIDARVWCVIDNELYFGTSDGLICKFYDGYADITYQDTEEGDLVFLPVKNAIAFNTMLDRDLNENDEIKFTNGDLYSLFLNNDEILSIDDEGYVVVSEENIDKIYDGIKVYADSLGEAALETYTEYEIGIVDRDNLRFPLLKDGEQINPNVRGFRLCKKVSADILYAINIDYENSEFQLKEFESGEVLQLAIYDFYLPTELTATIKYKQNIKAEWFTPIYDLGTNVFSKTLFNVTVATEPLKKGSITVGYQTRNLSKDFLSRGTREFDFNDINFEDFSFEGSFASSYTLRAKERNFNFIVIRYVSDNQYPCAVNSIAIRYKINQINKGVR